jgi:Ig domain of plant-specific actin-binding protein
MRSLTDRLQKLYLAILGGAAIVAALAVAFAATLAGTSEAAPAVAPDNTAEPRITGTPRVGQVLRTTRGTWTGTLPIQYEFRWFRCEGAAAPDASNCRRISNASDNTYVLRQADAGFRIRSQVVARNSEGQDTATSNPTSVVTAARPVNTAEPSISGTAAVGSRLQANRGEWAGNQPITYSFQWLRCSPQADNCSEIAGANDTDYEVETGDTGRTIRVRVTARNDRGSSSAISNPTAVVGGAQEPPPGSSIPVGDLRSAGDRLVVASVSFDPNPVTSRTAPIMVRVRVTARGGRPVRGALVFMRATPRVVEGQTLETQADGVATLTLVPNRLFPQPRNGFNVQFFIKASRRGDPALGGIAGYRLVQVRLAG